MTHDPGAGLRGQLVDKGHIHMIHAGAQNPLQQRIPGGLLLRLGLHFHGVLLVGRHHIIPQGAQNLLQLGSGEVGQALEGVDVQPQQQRLLRQEILPVVQRLEGILQIVEAGVEGAPLLLRPGLAHFLTQMAQELGIVSGSPELHGVQPGTLEKFQKFIVGLDPGLLALGRQNPLHIAGNPGCAEVPQHTDPLVALLHIEIAQIFKALDGIGDARLAEMGGAQVHPFSSKLRPRLQQGAEGGGEGGDPPGGFHADNPLRRQLHQPHILYGVGGGVRQNFVQNQRMRVLPLHHQLPVFLLTLSQSLCIFFNCGLMRHGKASLEIQRFILHDTVFPEELQPENRKNPCKNQGLPEEIFV